MKEFNLYQFPKLKTKPITYSGLDVPIPANMSAA